MRVTRSGALPARGMKLQFLHSSNPCKKHYTLFRYNDAYEGEHFLLPSTNSRSPKIAVEYIRRPNMSRYNPALRNLIPIRHGKQYVSERVSRFRERLCWSCDKRWESGDESEA